MMLTPRTYRKFKMEDGKHAFPMAYCLKFSLICRYSVKEKCFLDIIKSLFIFISRK